MCGRWNATIMTMSNGKAIGLQFLDVTQDLLGSVGNFMPHRT